jgi:hypothetical protein
MALTYLAHKKLAWDLRLVTKILLPLSLFDRAAGFLRPTAEFPSRHAQIGQGRPSLGRLVLLNATRPRLDCIEHAGMLDASG